MAHISDDPVGKVRHQLDLVNEALSRKGPSREKLTTVHPCLMWLSGTITWLHNHLTESIFLVTDTATRLARTYERLLFDLVELQSDVWDCDAEFDRYLPEFPPLPADCIPELSVIADSLLDSTIFLMRRFLGLLKTWEMLWFRLLQFKRVQDASKRRTAA